MSNIQPYIILNGTDSRTISGLLISALAPISKPLQRTLVDTVDGRDGDLVTPLGFSAYDKTISIALTYGYDIDDIIEYFNSEGVVTFSNEPDKYYRYAIYEQIDFERLIRFKTAEVTLHCQPFKFSTTETPKLFNVTSVSPITVKNDGNYQSRPNLTIIGSGDVDLSLNGSQVLSLDLEDNQAIIIDTEDMNAYAAQTAIKEVIAEINPVQDLHGQEYPYPAGGGANKWDEQWESGYWNVTTGLPVVNADYIRCKNFISVNPNTTFYLSNSETSSVNNEVLFFDVDKNLLSPSYTDVKGNATFTTPANCYFIKFYMNINYGRSYNHDIAINYPSTVTTYSPYSNICPITGFTESNVRLYGADICGGDYLADLIVATFPNAVKDEVNKTVSYTAASANSRKLFDKFKPNTVYTFFVDTASANTNIAVQYTDGTSMRLYAGVNVTSSSKSVAYLRGQNQTQSTVLNYEKCGVMEGALTAEDFVPYLGSEYTIEFVDDQGNPITAYGGNINYTTGVLTFDYLLAEFKSSDYWAWNNSLKGFRKTKAEAQLSVSDDKLLCNAFKKLSSSQGDCGILFRDTYFDFVNLDLIGVTDVATWKSLIDTFGGSIFCTYKIATPIEIQLTPTQINNLLGVNQLYTDTNGDITVTFSSDGVIRTETGEIVSFDCGAEDMTKGILLNRLITGDYDKIRLKKGNNTLVLSGGAQQLVIDKYSRWL